MPQLFLAPHNDDEALFGAFTLLRERPLVVVVTDSYVQWNRGDGITADQRWNETLKACEILGVRAMRLGLRDDTPFEELLKHRLQHHFKWFGRVYAPALQGSHPHHDVVSRAASAVFPGLCSYYCTYSPKAPFYANTGQRAIVGTHAEWILKHRALAQYPSQIRSRGHFEAVIGQPEWLSDEP